MEDKEKENTAEWTFQNCPKCGLPFIARDRFGLFCATGNCDWKEQDEKTNMDLLSTPSKAMKYLVIYAEALILRGLNMKAISGVLRAARIPKAV